MKEKPPPNNRLLWQYAGIGTQLLVSLGLSAYGGIWLDRWFHLKLPVFVWLLPLVVIILMIGKALRDTTKKQ